MTGSSHPLGSRAFWAGVSGERLRLVGATSVTIVRHRELPQRAEFLNFAMNCAALALPTKPDSVPSTGEYFQLTLRREGGRVPLALEARVTGIARDYDRICVGCSFAGQEALKAWLPNHTWNHLLRRSLSRLQPLRGEPITVALVSHERKLMGDVVDISLGGMLAVFPGVRLQGLECGQRVALNVLFPQRSQTVRVCGSIVRCSYAEDGLRCGIVLDCSAVLGWHTAEDAINAFLVSRPRATRTPRQKHTEVSATPWSTVAERVLNALEGLGKDDRRDVPSTQIDGELEVAVEGNGLRLANSPTPILQFKELLQTRPHRIE
jgi:hypothetical protein